MQYIPYLLPCYLIRRKDKSIRLSKLEIAQNFLPYFEVSNIFIFFTVDIIIVVLQTMADADAYLASVKSNALATDSPVLPRITLVGNINKPDCYVIIGDMSYQIEDPLKAFEACFNAFFALNLKYPDESQHCWTFAQRGIFNIETKNDKALPSVESLLQSIKNALLST